MRVTYSRIVTVIALIVFASACGSETGSGGAQSASNSFTSAASTPSQSIANPGQTSQDAIPQGATEAGFETLTWSITSFSPQNVDLQRTRDSKYKMFIANYFQSGSYTGEDPSNIAINPDGSITLGKGEGHSLLGSVARINERPNTNFVGTAFGGGGYFEAVIKFETQDLSRPEQSSKDAISWPAWWSMSAEHIVQRTDLTQWMLQQPGYEHFVEPDFFEALAGPNSYIVSVHDWYGIWNVSCPQYCNSTPQYSEGLVSTNDVNWREPHKVAGRWIPATDTNRGSLALFLDDRKVAEWSWSKYDDRLHAPPVMPESPWRFGVIDQQHLVLLISGGFNWPMTVLSIKVWQRDASKNISRFPDAA
jgi:hypothetical protein